MIPTIERFRQRATRDFANLKVRKPSDKLFSVVFAGYCYDDTPPRCYTWLVSNFETLNEQKPPLAEPLEEFNAQYYREKRPTEDMMHMLVSIGSYGAVSAKDIESLVRLLDEKKPAQALVEKGIEVIRTTAADPLSRNLIGKQCNSIVLPSNPDEDAEGGYYSEKAASIHYNPTSIRARCDGTASYIIAEPEVEFRGADSQPLLISVPRVGRNQPCPCGSGRKYKYCHGLRKFKHTG